MAPLDSFGRPGKILLLGGTSDIGQAIVRRMVDGGARSVVLAGRERGPSAPEFEADVEWRQFDAADETSHAKFFEDTFADHPDIDVVIIAFGLLHPQDAVEADPGLGVEMVRVNYLGSVSALLHAARHLKDRGAGQIVVLSSVAGVRPRRSNFVYGSSKAAIDFVARGLADEVAADDVHVLVVRPGFVHTSMTEGMEKAPFSVSPDTVARAVVSALARNDRVVWVPRVLRYVMGVVRLLPRPVVDRLED